MDLTSVVNHLASKIASLEYERKVRIQQINKEYEEKISRLKTALDVIKQVNDVCLDCGGSGSKKYIDASGNWDTMRCPSCNGSGAKPGR